MRRKLHFHVGYTNFRKSSGGSAPDLTGEGHTLLLHTDHEQK